MSWLTRVLRKPGFWLLIAGLVLITLPHYSEVLKHPNFLTQLTADLGLARHAFERILYLAPILWAGFLFGGKGAVVTSLVAVACMLPRAIFLSPVPKDALFETSAVLIIGCVVSLAFQGLRKERERRTQLTALNQTATVLSQSLELSQVLKSSMDNVMDVMAADAILIFLADQGAGELVLASHQGVSEEFVQGMRRIRQGTGYMARVAETAAPLFVEDASQDPSFIEMVGKQEGMKSQLTVPMKSKGAVVGTLCVATHSHRRFRPDEVELVTAIGNQIGVAVENARLYKQEQEISEQLRASEESYRELFESAHDAIWLHDLKGNITAANKACVRLTGYSLEELHGLRVTALFSEDSLEAIRDIEQRLLNGEASGSISEASLIRQNGTAAFVQLATSLMISNGQPSAFQYIARDVTEERRMRENLRFYLGRITKAQEEERKRIAYELHDETIQALVVLSRQLDALASRGETLSTERVLLKDAIPILENLRQQVSSIMEGVRHLCQDLRPATLDRLGMVPALEWFASDIARHSGIAVEVKTQGVQRRLPADEELLLFRIAQEALRNVWRHSQATSAEVIVEFGEGKTRVTVSDNGKGFELPDPVDDLARAGKLGLAGIRERARLLGGSVKLESQPSKGTTVTVEAPI